MAVLNQAQAVAVQLEKTRKVVPRLYEVNDTLCSRLIKNGENVERVSMRAMRIPHQMRSGGRGGYYSADGGDMGRGTGTRYDPSTITPIDLRFAVEFTERARWATDRGEKAVQNVVKRETVNAMKQFKSFIDKLLNADAAGAIGQVASFVTTTWTLASPMGATGVYGDQAVLLWSSDLLTQRTGTAIIQTIDKVSNGTPPGSTHQLTVDANPTGIAANDFIFPEGLSGTPPTDFLFSVKYHNSNAATGTWQSLNRANFPEVRTPRVNAQSSALATGHIRLALNKILMSLGPDNTSGLLWYCHPAQTHAYEQLGVQISRIEKKGGNQGLDRLFGKTNMTMAGIGQLESINADPSRIDGLSLRHWGRGVTKEVGLYTNAEGTTYFPLYAAGGGLNAAEIFYYVTTMQVFTDNPQANVFIDTLAVPVGYHGG